MRLEIVQCELCEDFVSLSENGPLTAHGHCKSCAEPDQLPCSERWCGVVTDTYVLDGAGRCPGCVERIERDAEVELASE